MELENIKLKKLNGELTIVNSDLRKDIVQQKDYVKYLEEIMIRISHKIRQPIAHILGLASLLNNANRKQSESKLLKLIEQAVKSLEKYTRELSTFIYKKVQLMKRKL